MSFETPTAIVRTQFKEEDWEQVISMGIELSGNETNLRFALGDLAEAVTKSFGPKMFRDWAKEIGTEVSTIRRYRDVSKATPQKVRGAYPKLSWSIFRMAAPHETKDRLLELADDNCWSVEKFGKYLKALDQGQIDSEDDGIEFGEGETAVPEKPKLILSEELNKWYIENEKEDARWLQVNK